MFHSYTYGGTYKVTLTVTDVGGNVATSPRSHDRRPRRLAASGAAAAPVRAARQARAARLGGGISSGAPAGNPVAAAAVISHSLKTALKKGLSVRYSVNEQVAGHFEVLSRAPWPRT